MGSAASVSQQTPPALLRDLSPLQVSELLGVGYEPYKENIVYQEVDGAYLSSLKTDADFAMCAALLDITDDQHIKSLTNDLTNFKNKQDPLFGTPPVHTLSTYNSLKLLFHLLHTLTHPITQSLSHSLTHSLSHTFYNYTPLTSISFPLWA